MPGNLFDFSSLSPVERIELADTLYDSAMLEIEAAAPALTPEQLAELDRRIAEIESGHVALVPWDEVYTELMRGR